MSAFFIFIYLYFRNWLLLLRKPRHKRNVKTAKKVIITLRGLTSDTAALNYLKKINPYVFEELVLELFKQAGWAVWRTPSYSADGGIDGKVYHKYLGWHWIQSKCYSGAISAQHVREFITVVGHKRGGFFVHSGTHSEAVRKMVKGGRVRLISGGFLVAAIRQPQKVLGIHQKIV